MSSPQGWISVNRWSEFQTYDTGRNQSGQPPWIRTYTRLMRDDDYMSLPGNRVAILHRLWLEYASTACQLRADTRELSRRLNLRVTVRDLEALNHAGFIRVVARKVDAEGAQAAGASRVGEEVEVEVEEVLDRSSRSEITRASRPDLTESEEQHKEEEGEEPFASEPEPPLNGTRDNYGPQPLGSELEQLMARWKQESA